MNSTAGLEVSRELKKCASLLSTLICALGISACKQETQGNQIKGLPVGVSPASGPNPRLFGLRPSQVSQELGAESRCDFREGSKILLVASGTGGIAVVDHHLRRLAAEDFMVDRRVAGVHYFDGGVDIRISPYPWTQLRHGAATSQQAILQFREGSGRELSATGIWSCGS